MSKIIIGMIVGAIIFASVYFIFIQEEKQIGYEYKKVHVTDFKFVDDKCIINVYDVDDNFFKTHRTFATATCNNMTPNEEMYIKLCRTNKGLCNGSMHQISDNMTELR